jgi:hypothetical protein
MYMYVFTITLHAVEKIYWHSAKKHQSQLDETCPGLMGRARVSRGGRVASIDQTHHVYLAAPRINDISSTLRDASKLGAETAFN